MKAKGFTLIELLVVISIVALLASIVLASLNAARDKGRMGAIRSWAAQVDHVAGEQSIGTWDFDECSGTTAGDRSGFGNNGLLVNGATSTWSSDVPGTAGCSLSLNGSNQYVNLGNPAILDVSTGDFSFSLWFKTTTSATVWFMDKKFAGSNTAGYDVSTNATIYFRTANGTTQSGVTAASGTVINDGLWHNLVGVIDRTNSRIIIYLDGKRNNSNSFNSAWDLSGGGQSLNIGRNNGNGGYFPGQIDSVHLFAKTISAAEVYDLYALERPSHPLTQN